MHQAARCWCCCPVSFIHLSLLLLSNLDPRTIAVSCCFYPPPILPRWHGRSFDPPAARQRLPLTTPTLKAWAFSYSFVPFSLSAPSLRPTFLGLHGDVCGP